MNVELCGIVPKKPAPTPVCAVSDTPVLTQEHAKSGFWWSWDLSDDYDNY